MLTDTMLAFEDGYNPTTRPCVDEPKITINSSSDRGGSILKKDHLMTTSAVVHDVHEADTINPKSIIQPAESHAPPSLSWAEFYARARDVVSEVTKLTDGLESSILDETLVLTHHHHHHLLGLINRTGLQVDESRPSPSDVQLGVNSSRIKQSIKKCRLFQASDLVESLTSHIRNWDTLSKTWVTSQRTDRFDSAFSNKAQAVTAATSMIHGRTIAELKAILRSRTAQFVVHLHDAVLLGLQMMAIVGIETLTASTLQKAIVGVVAFNNLLQLVAMYNKSVESMIESMLPAPVSIKKILSIIGEQQSLKMANILAEILEETMKMRLTSSSEGLFLMSTSTNHPWTRNLDVGEDSDHRQVTSDYGSEVTGRIRYESSSSSTQIVIGDCLTRFRTMQSQDELNIGKLVSVIYLTFMDVVQSRSSGGVAGQSKSGEQLLRQWWTANDKERARSSSIASEPPSAMGNLPKYYRRILEAKVIRSLKWQTYLRDVLLMPSSHLIDVGDCALNLCRSLEAELPMTKLYRQLRSHLYVEAVRKAWDSGMSSALAAASDPKCVTAVLIESGQGTRAGQCFVASLEPIVRLELAATMNDKDLDVQSIHFVVFPRLLASLQLTGSWLETRIRYALTSWQITPFCLITHSDLKMIIDLLKHTVNVNPIYSRNLDECDDQQVAGREAALRNVALWEQINRAITKIQNCSSTCMKEFCRVCSGRIDVTLQESMPRGKEWRQKCKKKGIPTECGLYARALVDEILGPVIDGVCRLPVHAQISILTMATKALCEAWMAHILSRQIKFSLHGAHLLKLDFGHLTDFLRSQPTLSLEARQSVLALEVMRRLRGVVALLLRQSEATDGLRLRRRKVAPMTVVSSDFNDTEAETNEVDAHRMEGMDSVDSIASDSLVDEDYVLNKEQWLMLRVHASSSENRRSPFWCFF